MKIKKQNIDLNLLINKETNFKTDLGWEEGMIVQTQENKGVLYEKL